MGLFWRGKQVGRRANARPICWTQVLTSIIILIMNPIKTEFKLKPIPPSMLSDLNCRSSDQFPKISKNHPI